MSKYIIDLRPDCKVVQQICVSDDNVGVGARSVELFDALTDEYVKENFKDLLEGEYQRGLEEGKKATFGLVADASNAEYQKGFEDGKAVHEKGCEGCMYNDGTKEHSPCDICCNAYLNRWTAKADKIGVGDVVEAKSGTIFVVTKITADGFAVGFTGDGNTCCFDITKLTKTGEHYNINEILGGLCDD